MVLPGNENLMCRLYAGNPEYEKELESVIEEQSGVHVPVHLLLPESGTNGTGQVSGTLTDVEQREKTIEENLMWDNIEVLEEVPEDTE